MNKKIMIPAFAIVLTGITFYGAVNAFADETSNRQTSIIERLVQKFGLKEADVKAVFTEERTERQKQMQTKMEEKLTQTVKDGKLSEAQKQAIITKQKELRSQAESEHQNEANMTTEQRQQLREKHRQELEAWAKAQGIDIMYLMGGFGHGMKGGFQAK